ncbi:hypothetical protein QEN19_002401 [Hanseniaspora menglaensis]
MSTHPKTNFKVESGNKNNNVTNTLPVYEESFISLDIVNNEASSYEESDIEYPSSDLENENIDIAYPEKNWKLLAGSFFGVASSWGLFFICGTYQDYYSKHQLKDYTNFQVSWIFSLYYFLIVSGNLLTGLYFDFYGFPKFLAFLLIIGYILLPFVDSYWQIICVFVCIGLGGGILIPPILGCISDNFYKKRSFANSVAIAGGNIVGIIYPVILNKGFFSLGYRNTSFIISGSFLIQLGLCLLLCKDRKELRRKPKPDETFLSLYLRESFDYRSLFTNSSFLLVTVGITAAEVSTASLLIYITSYCSGILNFSDSESFNIITVLNVGALFGGITMGIFFADKIGKVNSIITACFIMMTLNLLVWLWLSQKVPKLMYLFSILWGFCYGGSMSLFPSVCGLVSKYYDFGKKYSTIYFIVGIGFLAGIPVSGVIIGSAKKLNFEYFNAFCSALMLLAILCFILLKVIYLQTNLTYKKAERISATPAEYVEDSNLSLNNLELTETDDMKLTFKTILCTKF